MQREGEGPCDFLPHIPANYDAKASHPKRQARSKGILVGGYSAECGRRTLPSKSLSAGPSRVVDEANSGIGLISHAHHALHGCRFVGQLEGL
jgi:hypothetical protein